MRQVKTYFVKNNINNLVKIGKTYDLDSRLNNIRGQCAFIELTVFHVVVGNFEGMFHKLYSDFRKDGEWFDIPDLSIDKIEADLKGFPSYLEHCSNMADTRTFLEKSNHAVTYYSLIHSLRRIYGELGDAIIKQIDEIVEPIKCIVVKQGNIGVNITKERHYDFLSDTIDCEMMIIVKTGEREVKFSIREEEE